MTPEAAPLPEPPFVIVDTETSGFPGQRAARVVELAAVYVSPSGEPAETFSSLVRWPPVDMPDLRWDKSAAQALAVSGIGTWDLLNAPTADEVWRRFCDFGVVLPKGTTLAAFNEPFDARLIADTFGPMAARDRMPWSGRCLMKAARVRVFNGNARVGSLADIGAKLGLVREGAGHRALPDALYTYKVWRTLVAGIG